MTAGSTHITLHRCPGRKEKATAKGYVLDLYLFPESLRRLMSIPTGSQSDEWEPELARLTTAELLECMGILMEEYPGGQVDRKQRIGAEIRRRQKKSRNGASERATLPRRNHWKEDFDRIWEETCKPFRLMRRTK